MRRPDDRPLGEMSLREAVAVDDVEAAAIALAMDHDPSVRPNHVRAELDAVAGMLAPEVGAAHGHARLGRLLHGLYGKLGFTTPATYDDPRLHHLHAVLEQRAGSPVALAIVLVSVAKRLGITLSGVAFPGHFMVRYEASEPVFVDPSNGAFPFPADCLRKLAQEELRVDDPTAARFLLPVATRTFTVRLLQNLQRSYEEWGEVGHALVVADRLYEVTGSATARCERGLKAARLGAPHAALDDLSAYLRDHRDADVEQAAAQLQPTPHHLN